MLRSIRWTLQLWHAAILVLAVVGIGSTGYFAIQRARYHQIDSELEAAGQLMVARLHTPERRSQQDQPSQQRDRPPFRHEFGPSGLGGRGDQGGPPDDSDRGFPPEDRLGPPDFAERRPENRGLTEPFVQDRLPREIEMPPGFFRRYGGDELDSRSFVIFNKDGTVAKAFGIPYDKKNLPPGNIRPADNRLNHIERQAMHEVYLPGPAGSTVLVAGSVQRVDTDLRQLLGKLGAAGAGVLAVGLLGGWLISRLAVRPIGLMSATAGSISATRLTGRIDSRRVPTELRDLALVLNGMFERLEIAFQQQARFTADASHELRTPLTVVLSHTELALSRDRSAEEYRKTIDTCHSAAVRMKLLVESLLLLSHADVGELALQPVPMDLSDVVRDNVNLLHTLAGARSITLATQLQNATLIGDPFRLGQVIANLLSNAIRYNLEGGSIAVTTEIILEDAVITIADTGTGISTEDQKHIFERFFRADKARSRVAGGSGLGLAICKSILEAHGGIVECTSEIGVGTTFIVRVPRRIEDPTLFLPAKIEV